MSTKCFQLEVAPLTVLPFQKAVFSYLSHEPVSPGDLVRISFAGRTLSGAIMRVTPLEETTDDLKRLKYIGGVINPSAFTEHQIQLAQSISQDTFTSLGKVLKHMDPKCVTERVKKTSENGAPVIKPPRTTKEDAALVTSITALPAEEKRIFLTLPSTQAGLLSLVRVLLAHKKKDSQTLVLVPDILLLEQVLSLLTTLAPKETSSVAVLHSHRSAGAYYSAWQNTQNGSAQIILATRHGIFAPFKNLATIFHIEPSDDAYKQWDMSPRYQTSAAVDTLLGLTDARLFSIGTLPFAATITLGELPATSIAPEYINLRFERYQKNFGAISTPLEAALRETLSREESALLFIHQSGLESFSVCAECKTIFRCPQCTTPLRLTVSDEYTCHQCNYKSSLFPSCPECHSIHFKSVGFGSEKVKREVQKMFPGATVFIADKKHLAAEKDLTEYLQKIAATPKSILITTGSLLRFPPLPKLTLTAIIDADSLLSFPDFRKDERFLEYITRAKSQLPPNTGRLLVQTFHPENHFFQSVKERSVASLSESLFEERELLLYPPFARGITISQRPKKKGSAEALPLLFTELSELAKTEKLRLQWHTKKMKLRTTEHIVLRYVPPMTPTLTALLTRFADITLIDQDPLTLI